MEQAIKNMRQAHPAVNKIILLASTTYDHLKGVLEHVDHIDVAILNGGASGIVGPSLSALPHYSSL